MKKAFIIFSFCCIFSLFATDLPPLGRPIPLDTTKNMSNDIPVIAPIVSEDAKSFEKIENVAEYKNANWDNVIGIARDISLNDAYKIANNDPNITYFFYMKGHRMALEKEDKRYHIFYHHDAVFFSGKPWWGSAEGFADGYIKK